MESDVVNTALKTRKKIQRGATLVEVLIAVLVLSIGLLGVAGLQLNALQNNLSAHVRSQASTLAYYIADRMRANRAAAVAGSYNITFGTPAPTGTANIYQTDLQNWKAELQNVLPAGDGELVVAGDMAIIRVRWTDRTGTETFETRTRI
jgi:type IV pilus assembly protein PilV